MEGIEDGTVQATEGKTKAKGGLKDLANHRKHEMFFFADQIRPRGHNLRMWQLERNRKKVIAFARIAREKGIIVPIQVALEKGEVLIDHGETRWLCVKLLEGDDIHGVLRDVTDPETLALKGCLAKNTINIPATAARKANELDRLIDTITTNNGGPLGDLELARGIKQAIDWGKTQGWIADQLGGKEDGWTQTRVSHLYQLTLASPRLQQLVGEEVVTTTSVVEAMREHGDKAEEFVLAAVEDAKAKAAAEAAQFEAEARDAQAEVTRLMREGDDGMVVPAPGKRPITKVEHAQRRASQAGEKAEAARKVAENGPNRVTSREIAQAVSRRNPDAKVNAALSRAAQTAFVDAVRFEAQYSPHEPTRTRMNNLLVRYGFVEMSARVDNDGNELPLPEEQAAAA